MSAEGLGRGLEVDGGTKHRITFIVFTVFLIQLKVPNPEKSYLINLRCLRFISNCVIVIFVITNESTLSPLVDEVLHGLLLYQVEAHEVETEADK